MRDNGTNQGSPREDGTLAQQGSGDEFTATDQCCGVGHGERC